VRRGARIEAARAGNHEFYIDDDASEDNDGSDLELAASIGADLSAAFDLT
jgi:hypothetical protein